MIEISFFGVLAGTLVSGLSLVFLLVALGALTLVPGAALAQVGDFPLMTSTPLLTVVVPA